MNSSGLSIVTRPAAAAEIDAAYRWYERERPGLGEEFLAAVNDLVGVIGEHPQRFQATTEIFAVLCCDDFHIASSIAW